MSFHKIGNWGAIETLVANLQHDLNESAKLSVRRFALKAEGLAKKHISAQDLNWKPLSPKYAAQKARQGFSTNIYVRTATYFTSITSWTEGLTGLAGIKRTAKGQDGEDLANVAKVLEYGSASRNIEKRPLWDPVMKETVQWHMATNLPSMIFLERAKAKYGVI